jgi:hypothetical protein
VAVSAKERKCKIVVLVRPEGKIGVWYRVEELLILKHLFY